MAEIKSMLDNEIENEIENLSSLEEGEEKSRAIKDLAQLHKLRIDEIKTEAEVAEKRDRLEYDERVKMEQAKENKIDRWVKIGTAAAELGAPLLFYGIWMNKGFKFEETGSFTSTTFKNLLSRFRPTK